MDNIGRQDLLSPITVLSSHQMKPENGSGEIDSEIASEVSSIGPDEGLDDDFVDSSLNNA